MEATLETPSVQTTQVAPQDLPADFDISKWAQEVDNGTATESPSAPAKQTDGQAPADGAQAPAPEAKPAAQNGEANKAGNTPASDKATAPEAAKPETEFAKAQKEADRKDRSWKALEAEKTQFRQERGALLTELQQLRQQMTELRARAEPARDKHGMTAEDYERMAQKKREQGEDGIAEAALERAAELRRQQPAAAAYDPTKDPAFVQAWNGHIQALQTEEPELANADNPVTKAANALLADKQWAPFFTSRPDGIRAAVEVAKIIKGHADMAGQLKAKDAEIERLTKLTSLRGSPAGGPPAPKKGIEEMPDEEAHAELLRIARAADRGE
jgi:hypothetical protein